MLDEANETVEATLTLRGVAPVTVRVVASDGVSPISSAPVTLVAEGSFGNEAVRAGGGNAQRLHQCFWRGVVPERAARRLLRACGIWRARRRGDGIDARRRAGLLGHVQLGASGSIAGRVLLPDGVTPAARAFVTLNFQSQSGLQSGVLQVTTDLSGRFSFGGIPLGTFSLSAFEVVSNGVRTRLGTLTTDGQTLDLGDIALDNTGPRVIERLAGRRGCGRPRRAPRSRSRSASRCSRRPCRPPTSRFSTGPPRSPAASTISADRRTVTFTPAQPLRSGGVYLAAIKGAPDGPRDESNIALVDPFVSTFAVRDVIPPTVVSLSPAANAREVLPEAVVRVTFSEPVADRGARPAQRRGRQSSRHRRRSGSATPRWRSPRSTSCPPTPASPRR